MKSKASFFSLSRPLIIENLRRFWAIPVLSFLVYFLSGIFPILMSYSRLNNVAGYIEMSLNNQQPFYMFAHLMFPIMTAVIIFKYLQGISSVSVMHAMPFTRMKLYNSGFVSGLILILAPILLNGIILLAISKPVYRQYGSENGLVTESVNLFARMDILNWIWVSIIIVLVVYAVSVFAGIVTGNSLMHFSMAVFFNFLIPGLYAVFIAYFSRFLYGFDTSGSWMEFCLGITPFLNAIQKGGEFGLWVTVYYIATFVVLYILSAILYSRRKLEHATDSLAFGFLEPIICWLIAFLGMTLLGFYFDALGKSELYLYAGLAAGTLIFFIIGQMIVKKTPRVFNRSSLKNLGLYALAAILFIVSLNFDITGFEKRVPNPAKISSIQLSETFNLGYNYNYDHNYRNNNGKIQLKDKDNIKALVDFHRSILANRDRFEGGLQNYFNNSFAVEYNPDSAFPMNRRYQIDYEFFRNSLEFKKIYESKEYKDFYSLKNLNFESLKGIYISSQRPFSETVDLRNQEKITEFLECLEADFQAQTFEDWISLRNNYAIAEISYTYKNPNSGNPEAILNGNISYRITDNYKNTINWLKENGYESKFAEKADQVEFIEIYHYQNPNADLAAAEKTSSMKYEIQTTSYTMYTGKALKITDPQSIQELLDTYETANINYNDYYYGRIVYKSSVSNSGITENNYDEKLMEKGMYENTMQIYLNEGNIPNYVLEYFK